MEVSQKNVDPPTGDNVPVTIQTDNNGSNGEHVSGDGEIVHPIEAKVTSSDQEVVPESQEENGLLCTINPELSRNKKRKLAKMQKQKSFPVYISKRNEEPFTEKDFLKEKLILNRLALSACKDGSWEKFFPCTQDVLAVDKVVLEKPTMMKLVCANVSTADWLRRIKLPPWLKVVSKKRFKELELSLLIDEYGNVDK
ncbi:uncharacterized protein LOC106672111 isoform X2 [Cimex lectularius]|uniref:Uncharacterized protein n=1 Tax=Cimex lectularius TaxID=79782 RepID=A0A8I6S8W2_CIMLE|nr:uncharacterized protein LOC106672111 isoform X2 [Cimex lectularius]XP_024080996.1 uncharacterized protein LOC106672111 isoform X2 [Cimex lectularius]